MGLRRPQVEGAPAHAAPAHAAYLAVIAVLVLVVAVLSCACLRARALRKEFTQRYGLERGAGIEAAPRQLRLLSAKELAREKSFEEYRHEVDGLVSRAHSLGEFGGCGDELAEACSRAMKGGKRLRPVILLEVARAAGAGHSGYTVDAAEGALVLEYLHTSSLVVDDLPEFDDDAERRGEASLHVATSRGVAQMAALSLLAGAFQGICRQVEWLRAHCPEMRQVDRLVTRVSSEVSRALGASGAAKGQFLDACIRPERLVTEHGPEVLLEIMALKTAALFEVAFVAGWLFAGGGEERAADLREAGRHFGLAFQAADDLGDMAQDAARVAAGKPGWNYANTHGEEAAEALVVGSLGACRRTLERLELFTPLWEEIYQKVWQMAGAAKPRQAAGA